jgi:hypothetical protein
MISTTRRQIQTAARAASRLPVAVILALACPPGSRSCMVPPTGAAR